MTTENPAPQSKYFVTAILPWLLGAGMLVVYLVTLNHWVTPTNLPMVVDVSDWGRGVHTLGPVAYLATSPFRLLPVGMVPIALNVFTAVCAALTLCQLARTVALLPHDRTFEQRQREESEFSFLTSRTAWVPPLFAVIVCGLQMTFWENAIDATGEVFDLLIFAFAIRCLVEYRITFTESWMIRFAIVYGLGMAEDYAMIALFPAFLTAVIWIRGLAFFTPRFLLRTAGCGLAGLSLFFLFPLMNMLHLGVNAGFWATVHATFISDKTILATFPREVVLVMGLASLLPVLVIGLRWASYFGDNSPIGIFMATSMFHIIHALFFLVCIWVALDAPISPRLMGYGMAFLPFYYLGALSIGYFTGYFLLIFATPAAKSKSPIHPLLRLVNLCVTLCIWVLVIAVPAILVHKNLPPLEAAKTINHQIEKYFERIVQGLPEKGAVVLSDDPPTPFPFRLEYLEATLHRDGKTSPHLLVCTALLSHDSSYPDYLQKRNPGYKLPPSVASATNRDLPGVEVIHTLDVLSTSHPLYYLHPSFGYFFERYYAEQQGLVFLLKPYPADVWDAPLVSPSLVASNQAYWKQTFAEDLPPLIAALQPADPSTNHGNWQKLMDKLHLKPEHNKYALPLGVLYSRDLDNWGVELECAGHIKEAGAVFEQAGLLNPFNISSGINKAFNNRLIAGKPIVVNPPKDLEQQLGQHRSWTEILTQDGPIDEPNCRDDLSSVMAVGGNYRQSVQHLNRIKILAPDNLQIPLQLAELMAIIQTYTNEASPLLPYYQGYALACSNADIVLRSAPDHPGALYLKGVSLLQLQKYDEAISDLSHLISLQSTNYDARLNRAIAYFKSEKLDDAKSDYQAVQAAKPAYYQASYGLAKIADKENDKDSAIKNYESYLTNAPTNTGEAKLVATRLKELKGGAPAP